MIYYLDLEATQFTNEIISIGCIREDGATFSSLVKPKHKVTKFITALTGITKEMADSAPTPSEVFRAFGEWTQLTMFGDIFYVYGDSDKLFLKDTARRCDDKIAVNIINHIKDNLYDYSKDVNLFFGTKTVGLKKVVSYIKNEEIVQKHDALEDAEMLKEVVTLLPTLAKPEESPFPIPQQTPPNPNSKRQKKLAAKKANKEEALKQGYLITKEVKRYRAVNCSNHQVTIYTRPGKAAKALNPRANTKEIAKMAERIASAARSTNNHYHNHLWSIIYETVIVPNSDKKEGQNG